MSEAADQPGWRRSRPSKVTRRSLLSWQEYVCTALPLSKVRDGKDKLPLHRRGQDVDCTSDEQKGVSSTLIMQEGSLQQVMANLAPEDQRTVEQVGDCIA